MKYKKILATGLIVAMTSTVVNPVSIVLAENENNVLENEITVQTENTNLVEDTNSEEGTQPVETPELPETPETPENPTQNPQNPQETVTEESKDKTEEVVVQPEDTVVQAEAVAVTITENEDATQCTVEAKNIAEDVTKVYFPIWSEANGQDDLVWYEGQKGTDGTWSVVVPLKNHKTWGQYQVHVYANVNDKSELVAKTTFEMAKPTLSLSISDQDNKAGTFRININNISSKSGVKKVQVPVWSGENQDNLVWYSAVEGDDGNYFVDIDIAKHKQEIGEYKIHVYVTDENEAFGFIDSTTTAVEVTAESLDVTDISGGKEEKYHATLSGVQSQGIDNVLFAIWSEDGGQDDLEWASAAKSEDGYTYDINIAKHRSAGKYQIHAYIKGEDGGMHLVKTQSFEVTKVAASNITVVNQDNKKGTFRVEVNNLSTASGVAKVQIPVWCADDQSDLVWYTAVEDKDGNYYVDVDIAKHKYHMGTYKADVYVTDKNGVFDGVGRTTAEVKVKAENLTAEDSSEGKELEYKVSLTDVELQGMKEVLFAVWSEAGGQDDIKWYKGTSTENGYECAVDIRNHKTAGTYQVHAYAKDSEGGMHMLKTTTFEVSVPSAQVEISDINQTNGTFKVNVSGIEATSGVSKVLVPVWCAEDQSDLCWYTAEKQSDGSYAVEVNVVNHQLHFGTYQVHVYVEMSNGTMGLANKTSAEIQALNYIYATNLDVDMELITIVNPNVNPADGKVLFPTWSNEGGQDDLVWYEGENNGDGSYSVVIDASRHKHSGEYTTHVYNSNNTLLGIVPSYSLQAMSEQEQTVRALAIQRILAQTNDSMSAWDQLYACYKWSVMDYDHWDDSVEPGYTRSQWFAIRGFERGVGDCYVMAATFYQMAKYLGYDAHYVEGSVPLASGGMGPHGWVEIIIDGTTYVFDPNFEHDTGRNGFQIYYGMSGTWRYSNYGWVD